MSTKRPTLNFLEIWARLYPRSHHASIIEIFCSESFKKKHMQKCWYHVIANMSRSLSLCLSSPTARSFCLLAFTDDRPASSPGVTWHAVLVWFSASAGDVNLFCLWLSFAAGCLSLFFEQIRLDGFHNRISAAVTQRNTEKLHSARTSDISAAYTLALARAQRSMKKLN